MKALFGVYGEQRDAEIANAKVVLNMHFYDQHIFEIVRVFYLMANGKAVVAEVNAGTTIEPRFLGGVRAVPYEGLAEACLHLARDAPARAALEAEALSTIRAHPQASLLAPLLDQYSSAKAKGPGLGPRPFSSARAVPFTSA